MWTLPRSVLTAVDFGDASARAISLGGAIAERCGAATLRLLHAESVEAPPYFTSDQLDALHKQRQATRHQAEQFLARFGAAHTRQPFTAVVDDRPPVEAVLHESASADLVVMGTHGRHGPKRWWLGSVAERVLRDVARPLAIVRADHGGPVESTFDRVLVHAAEPLVGRGTLQYARDLAACFQGEAIDGRGGLIEPALDATRATLLVVAAPIPDARGRSHWLSSFGEPLVRFCRVPIVFVPETEGGAS